MPGGRGCLPNICIYMYIYIYIYIYIDIYVYIYVYTYTYTNSIKHMPGEGGRLPNIYINTQYIHIQYIHIQYIHIHEYVHVYMFTHIFIHATHSCREGAPPHKYTCICIYIHTYIYIYINIYVHTHIHTRAIKHTPGGGGRLPNREREDVAFAWLRLRLLTRLEPWRRELCHT